MNVLSEHVHQQTLLVHKTNPTLLPSSPSRSAVSIVDAVRVKLTHLEQQRAAHRPSCISRIVESQFALRFSPSQPTDKQLFTNIDSQSISPHTSLQSPSSSSTVNSSPLRPSSFASHYRLYGVQQDEDAELPGIKNSLPNEWSEHAFISAPRRQPFDFSPESSPMMARLRIQLSRNGSDFGSPITTSTRSPSSKLSYSPSASSLTSSPRFPLQSLTSPSMSRIARNDLYDRNMAVQQSLVNVSSRIRSQSQDFWAR